VNIVRKKNVTKAFELSLKEYSDPQRLEKKRLEERREMKKRTLAVSLGLWGREDAF